MIITKTKTTRYEVNLLPGAWNIKQGEFIAGRKRLGLKTAPFKKCFCCGHKFTDDEIPSIVQVSNGVGNRFVCCKCAEKVAQHE